VVRYLGSYRRPDALWIVMEHCGGGSVSDLISVGLGGLRAAGPRARAAREQARRRGACRGEPAPGPADRAYPLPQVHGGGLSEEAIAYICAEALKVGERGVGRAQRNGPRTPLAAAARRRLARAAAADWAPSSCPCKLLLRPRRP
jgi:hypothetical protein